MQFRPTKNRGTFQASSFAYTSACVGVDELIRGDTLWEHDWAGVCMDQAEDPR
jgi:hypothetical protein